MSKLARNLSFATMTAAAVLVQSVLASSQHDAADAVTIRDLDGETYQNSLNIELLNDNYVNQFEVISNIASSTSANDARITGNDARITTNGADIAGLTTTLNDVAITAAKAWQWSRDNDGFVYQNQSRSLNNQSKISTQNGVISTQGAVIEGQAALIAAHKSKADSDFKKTWALANYNNGYVVDAWNMTLANEERLKNTQATLDETVTLLDTTTATANVAYGKAIFNGQSIEAIFDWTNVADMEIDAMNNYLGVMPDDYESDTPATLYKHSVQGNIHLGAGAQVGDNPNPGDAGFEGYDDPNAKTGMTALGANSRADADRSTAIGSYSTNYEDNTVSFGNDYQAEVLAVEAVEYQAAVEGQGAVIVDGETWYEEILPRDEVLAVEAVEAKPEILENNRRLTHVADGVNKNDVVNVNQLNTTAQYLDDRQRATEKRLLAGQVTWNNKLETLSDKAMHGIAISMATKVFLPDPGKKFRINVGVAEYEGASALGFSGSGRINNDTALYFGLGTDTGGNHTAVQAGASYQW
ncbi:MAG: YadA C-terminal domain-containing protein [Sedimenticola sp.]